MVENGTEVVAYNTKSFVFLREKSVGDPREDAITNINIPAWVSHELKLPVGLGDVAENMIAIYFFHIDCDVYFLHLSDFITFPCR